MNQSPPVTNSPGEQSSVFVLRRHDYAESFKAYEVLRERQRDARTAARKGSVCHCVLLEFWNISNARIFDTPYLFRVVARAWRQRRLGINPPSVNAVDRTGGAKVRKACPVFNTTK